MKNKRLLLAALALLAAACTPKPAAETRPTGADDRAFWIETMTRIADPVLTHLSAGTLKANMPYESLNDKNREVSYLEAFGRTISGIAPWLELGPDDTEEGRLRAKYIELAVAAYRNSVDPASPDYLLFEADSAGNRQPLVDASYFAWALLRAPTQLWGNFDEPTRERVTRELVRSRSMHANESNWLLFASMIEAVLLELTGECDEERLYYGVNRFLDEWYEGDSWYGDGHEFRMDYYNSYVINPMLTDILLVLQKHGMEGGGQVEAQLLRATRFAEIQERLISPEGTYPAVGRSITYRFGAFQGLAQAALMGILPERVVPAQVRCALTAVIRRQIEAPGTFDENGWLRIGFAGSQIHISEMYTNTGSLYICSNVFLPLGLPADDPFWAGPYTEWTNVQAWGGADIGPDKALRDKPRV